MTERTFISDFKRNFLTGFAALFPILITVFLLSWLYVQLDKTVGRQVNVVCRKILVNRPGLFEAAFPGASDEVVRDPALRAEYAAENFPGFVGVWIGILVALVVVYLVGLALRSYLGSRLMLLVDRFFERFPVVKAIYPHARQVADVLFGPGRRVGFRDVVAVQYPRRGVYSVGFRTGEGLKDVEDSAGEDLVAVFIPTSPTPLTGFVILVPPQDVTDLDMSVDEAFRFCMTAGMVAGPKQRKLAHGDVDRGTWLPGGEPARAEQGGAEGVQDACTGAQSAEQ